MEERTLRRLPEEVRARLFNNRRLRKLLVSIFLYVVVFPPYCLQCNGHQMVDDDV